MQKRARAGNGTHFPDSGHVRYCSYTTVDGELLYMLYVTYRSGNVARQLEGLPSNHLIEQWLVQAGQTRDESFGTISMHLYVLPQYKLSLSACSCP